MTLKDSIQEGLYALGLSQAAQIATILEKLAGGLHGKQKAEALAEMKNLAEMMAKNEKARADASAVEAQKMRARLAFLEEKFKSETIFGLLWLRSDGKLDPYPQCPKCRVAVVVGSVGQIYCCTCPFQAQVMADHLLKFYQENPDRFAYAPPPGYMEG